MSTHTSVKAYAAAEMLCSDTHLWLQLSVLVLHKLDGAICLQPE